MSQSRKRKDVKPGACLHGSDSQFPKQLKIVCNSRVFPQREKESLIEDFGESHLQSSSASSSSEKRVDPRQRIFDQGFYNRIEAFLDEEGLYPVDPKDALLGIRQFSKSKLSEESNKLSKSQTHSPTRLISCSPIESKLFQRRMSLSLAPAKLIERLCNSQVPKPSLDIKNPFFQKMKAIEEVDTPALSRNNSECAASTPKRVADSKQISRILKDLSNECKSRGSSANPLIHSASAESPELGSKRRRTDEMVPLNGFLKLKTTSSLILPSENSGRVSRRSKFFENGNQQICDDSFAFSEKKLQEDDCPPMA